MILFWGAIAACGGAVALVGFLVLMRSRTTGSALIGCGALITLGATIFIASWLFFAGRPQHSTSPSAFKNAFGYDPPADVTNIQSEATQSNDSLHLSLRFQTSPATIGAIVKRHHFAPDPDARCGAPACYVADRFDDAFASSHATLAYDPASRQAHFQYNGVD